MYTDWFIGINRLCPFSSMKTLSQQKRNAQSFKSHLSKWWLAKWSSVKSRHMLGSDQPAFLFDSIQRVVRIKTKKKCKHTQQERTAIEGVHVFSWTTFRLLDDATLVYSPQTVRIPDKGARKDRDNRSTAARSNEKIRLRIALIVSKQSMVRRSLIDSRYHEKKVYKSACGHCCALGHPADLVCRRKAHAIIGRGLKRTRTGVGLIGPIEMKRASSRPLLSTWATRGRRSES